MTLTKGANSNTSQQESSSASLVDTSGKQILEVSVKGGYAPKVINAKAGTPTILRMESNGALGCERAFSIPKLNISKVLPTNGNTDIDLGSVKAGTKLLGTCSMGMYTMTINFN